MLIGIISSTFSILEVGDEPKTFSHHLVMQHFEVYLHFYKLEIILICTKPHDLIETM